MLDRDPPDHTRLRRLVSKAFTPRAIEALRPRITELVDGMLDQMAQARRVDLVDALAFPLPFTVIAEMLGTPPADHERLRQLTGTVVRSLEPVVDPGLVAAIVAADNELAELGAEMIAWKRAHPADDLLTALIGAEDDGDVLDDDELVSQTLLLYIAGHETTVNLIAGGTLALLRHPGQLALLRGDPSLVGNAVEELLRYDSPVQASRRITLEPVTVRGTTIPAGAFVMAGLGSANRDEDFWGADAAERPAGGQHRNRAPHNPFPRPGARRRRGVEWPDQPARPGAPAGIGRLASSWPAATDGHAIARCDPVRLRGTRTRRTGPASTQSRTSKRSAWRTGDHPEEAESPCPGGWTRGFRPATSGYALGGLRRCYIADFAENSWVRIGASARRSWQLRPARPQPRRTRTRRSSRSSSKSALKLAAPGSAVLTGAAPCRVPPPPSLNAESSTERQPETGEPSCAAARSRRAVGRRSGLRKSRGRRYPPTSSGRGWPRDAGRRRCRQDGTRRPPRCRSGGRGEHGRVDRARPPAPSRSGRGLA